MTDKWSGRCPMGLHGLDYIGQPCAICPKPGDFKIDLTDASTSLLLQMLADPETFRYQLSFVPSSMEEWDRAQRELCEEIDRRFPIPGKKT